MFYTFSSPSHLSSSSFQLACMCDEMRLDIHNVESRQIKKLILKKPFGSSKNPVWWVNPEGLTLRNPQRFIFLNLTFLISLNQNVFSWDLLSTKAFHDLLHI